MEIFAFLFGLGCLVLFVWAIALFDSLISGWKYRRSRPPKQSLSAPPENKHQKISESPPVAAVQPRKVVTAVRPPVSTRVRLPSNKHQRYIRQAKLVLKQLREVSTVVQLPEALGILRQMNPYAFEELLLTCCHDQGWEIERNFKYSGDGGIDGRVTIAGRLYLIQAKRYSGHINPQHIRNFYQVVQKAKARGGFFIHTGKTGELSKELLRDYKITLLSGQRLVDFVLGQRLRIVG